MRDYIVFILSHGRASNVVTYDTLKKSGYTGKICLVVDDEDKTIDEYRARFDMVEVFSKKEIAKEFDEADNFHQRQTIVYARNACFRIAKKLGYKYFIELDDDYTNFDWRIYSNEDHKPKTVKNLDVVFQLYFDFLKSTPFDTIAMAQGGDFIGGKDNVTAKKPTIFRKCMNSFFCTTEKPFDFVGRINEDVNTYTYKQAVGLLMGTIPLVSLTQKTTQKNKGGMTETYLESGTYVKSFYTVIFQPSSVKIKLMGDKHYRLHHSVSWNETTPKIVHQNFKKK